MGKTYGWRVSEVRNMRGSQLDLVQRTIRLEPGTTKNRGGREVSMTDSVYTMLRECVHGKGLLGPVILTVSVYLGCTQFTSV